MGKLGLATLVCVLVGAAPARADIPKCRALDANDGALLLEYANNSATTCAAQLEATMRKRRCTKAPGAQVEYTTNFEHRGVQGRLVTIQCNPPVAKKPAAKPVRTARSARPAKPARVAKVTPAPKAPQCRAVDLRTKGTIAVAAQPSALRCAAVLAAEVKEKRCTKQTHGKKIEYATRFDQRGVKDGRAAVTCK
jgi:hypothetical protein